MSKPMEPRYSRPEVQKVLREIWATYPEGRAHLARLAAQ